MTVAAKASSVEYEENGVTRAFAAPFRFLSPETLIVERIALGAVPARQQLGIDYAVAGGGSDAGGTVTMTVPSIAGTRLRIRRLTARSQSSDYTTNDTFPAESHEAALDRQMLALQENDRDLEDTRSRALVVPDGEQAPMMGSLKDLANGDVLAFLGGRFLPLGQETFAIPAKQEADRAELARLATESIAALVEEVLQGTSYPTRLEGEDATTSGQFFRVSIGTEPETYTLYERRPVGSVVAAPLLSIAVLAGQQGGSYVSLTADAVDAVTRLLSDINNKRPLDPFDFGAIGDGETDDKDALQKWAAALADGGVGVVPKGANFACSGKVNIPGSARAVIGQGGIITFTTADGALILGTTIADPNSGAKLLDLLNLIIDKGDKVKADGFSSDPAIWGFNPRNLNIIGCKVLRCRGSGILLRAYPDRSADIENVLVEGNFLEAYSSVSSQFGIAIDAELIGDAQSKWKDEKIPLSSVRRARNFTIRGNTVLGFYYGISTFFSESGTIAGNIVRDHAPTIAGVVTLVRPVRGVVAQHGCREIYVSNNFFINTQSACVLFQYAVVNSKMAGNIAINSVWDYGNSLGGNVDGSQAPWELGVGCTDCSVDDNLSVFNGAGAGPEFFGQIGPHAHRARFTRNRHIGKVHKAGITIESSYDTATAPAGGYAKAGGFIGTEWANTDLTDVEVTDNKLVGDWAADDTQPNRPAIQVIQAPGAGIKRLHIDRNSVIGTGWTKQLALFEAIANALLSVTLRDNNFKETASAADFILPRGKAHFSFIGGNVPLNQKFEGFNTVDPPSIIAGGFTKITVSVPGVVFGDYVTGFGMDPQPNDGVAARAIISGAGFMDIILHNTTTAAIDPAVTSVYVQAERRIL